MMLGHELHNLKDQFIQLLFQCFADASLNHVFRISREQFLYFNLSVVIIHAVTAAIIFKNLLVMVLSAGNLELHIRSQPLEPIVGLIVKVGNVTPIEFRLDVSL